ncbi:hypothetical protein HMPREF9622_02089 [Cutibacterium modestum HL037PA3]|nr:hypothetical protein HMPREF9621_02079 [Cutibacterium modestum HL037PA2]EFT14839.1 hypothetical protein HMPREF9622_02089 [Cutibacterium modestum HL037PA3]
MVFAVGPMVGLMPGWCGEAGGSPALSRSRVHVGVWESEYQIIPRVGFVPSRIAESTPPRH